MISTGYNIIMQLLSFLPFFLFVFLDTKANLKKEIRNKQFFMPLVAFVYCIVLFVFMNKLGEVCVGLFELIGNYLGKAAEMLNKISFLRGASKAIDMLSMAIAGILAKVNPVYLILVLFNTVALVAYLIIKRIVLMFCKSKKHNTSLTNNIVSIFYDYDEKTNLWYIKHHFEQAKTFLKTAFYAASLISVLLMVVSFYLCRNGLIRIPFYPVFSIILIGELAFFIDGIEKEELENVFSAEIDHSRHVTNYVILRKRLNEVFGDKLSSEGTTVNDSIIRGGSIDQILEDIERDYGRTGKNYAMFIRKKSRSGFEPNADYLRSGIELTTGKSLLFNTPFYHKLTPYAFYAMHTALLKEGKVLIVLGRHGTTEDVVDWCDKGLFEVTNLPSLWGIKALNRDTQECDIGIITRSGVHDLEVHRANRKFLSEVSFVVLVEPSRLIATAQIGLNLLVKNINNGNNTTYCSVDRNCDGLVDSLSHILMTNITEVSATEYPQGTSSYMCWTADGEYLQHRLTPGISRYLGMGTELSFVALKNHVERAVWYGGESFPVLDAHWIAKQYYHELLGITPLPATQETFDKYFKVSYNLCNEQVRDNSYISVEDEFNNLFEVKRELSTISRRQGFVNVISSDYMLRGYMAENEEIFNADPKAIPYISADYARTKRNMVLKICLKMSINGIYVDELIQELLLYGADTDEDRLQDTVWKEICGVFCKGEMSEITVNTSQGEKTFTKDIISFRHEFSSETGKFEDLFVIEDSVFKQYVMDDLQSARYIAERETENTYLGTELKGHILQKYLPGQFATLNGKYYEMLSVTSDNQVVVRRASDHINNRYSYRQCRTYRIDSARDNDDMGMLKSINGVRVYNQFADFVVNTPAYWRMNAYNDFAGGAKVEINSVPQRKYINKNILKLDFSAFGEAFTDEVRVTITLLMNEVFRTLFAENQAYIVAVTAGEYEKPLTYSLAGDAVDNNSIYLIEDSQLDIGLLISAERNFERIMNIIADYLCWNHPEEEETEEVAENSEGAVCDEETNEAPAKNPFVKLKNKIKSFFTKLFGGKKKEKKQDKKDNTDSEVVAEPKENIFRRIFGKLFGKKKQQTTPEQVNTMEEEDVLTDSRTESTDVAEDDFDAGTEAEDAGVEINDHLAESEEDSDTSEESEKSEDNPKTKKKGLFGWFTKQNKKDAVDEDISRDDDSLESDTGNDPDDSGNDMPSDEIEEEEDEPDVTETWR